MPQSKPKASPNAGSIRGIVVIGASRSGTKFLSNHLLQHSKVFAVTIGENSSGIAESSVFSGLSNAFPDLSRPDEFVGFTHLWSESFEYRATKLGPDFLYNLEPRPKTPVAAFKAAMEEGARRTGCTHWLTKMSPGQYLRFQSELRDCRVVTITRDLDAMLRSRINVSYSKRPFAGAMFNVLERTATKKLGNDGPHVEFEKLRDATEKTLSSLCNQLDLPWEETMLDLPFKPNTSFGKTSKTRTVPFSVKAASRMVNLTPAFVAKMPIRSFYRHSRRLTRGTFRHLVTDRLGGYSK